jgi:translation initiation factor IF-3
VTFLVVDTPLQAVLFCASRRSAWGMPQELTGCLRAIRLLLEGPPVGSARGVASATPFFVSLERENAIARPLRVNEQIRIRQVRVIDAQPPVVKIGDYGRLKYEQSKKDKDARKKQRNFELREVKLRPKIETHDYETKARMTERLLLDGSKIKVTIMFRGREITYTAFGRRLLDRMAEDMAPLATVEREPRLEGKNMFMILAPRATPTGPPKFALHKEHKDRDHKDGAHAEREKPTKEPTSA